MLHISQKWRLDGLLNNQSATDFSKDWMKQLKKFQESLTRPQELATTILLFQTLSASFREFSSYAGALFSENVQNKEALALTAKAGELETYLQKASSELEKKLFEVADLEKFIQENGLESISFCLTDRCQNAKEKMSVDKEALSSDLALHGYHSWYELYKQAISKMRCDVTTEGAKGSYSISQLENLFSHENQEVRKNAFLALEKACKQDEALFSHMLRSIIGFRLELYKHRGWKSPLHSALKSNYMQQSTLDMMWKKVSDAQPHLLRFLDEKAKIFGVDMLSWYDFDAPFPHANSQISYEDAAKIIIELFSEKNKELGEFAKACFENNWIEAENRPNKAPGGFCAPFPQSKQSRIYMSYTPTMHNLLVLAHELGHAYHNHVCFEQQELAQHFPYSLAETASTTCELIVLDGLIAKAKSQSEKKWLFYEKAHRHTMFFLNIHARFFFEQELFSEVSKGTYLDAEKLCHIMEKAQKTAYGDRLETYHPHFWIPKIHFYITDIPSYNFPYTFGYLVSQAINAKAKQEPTWFTKNYQSFLQDTGSMSVEDLVKKHFGLNTNEELFWQKALDNALLDVTEFLAL